MEVKLTLDTANTNGLTTTTDSESDAFDDDDIDLSSLSGSGEGNYQKSLGICFCKTVTKNKKFRIQKQHYVMVQWHQFSVVPFPSSSLNHVIEPIIAEKDQGAFNLVLYIFYLLTDF